MSRTRILPYSSASKSAKIVSDLVDGKRIRLENSDYSWVPGDLVINWGNGYRSGYPGQLNSPTAVNVSVNKETFFCRLRSCGVNPKYYPRFWFRGETIPEDAFPVIARTLVEGARGEGATYVTSAAKMPEEWKLATEYLEKTREYRVHIGRAPDGEIVGLSALRLLRYNEYDPNPIQNHSNGYFHSKIEPEEVPLPVLEAAEAVFAVLGLDFCALDIGYNADTGAAKVFESNTAPAIEHEHVKQGYKEFFQLFQQWSRASECSA